MEDLMKPRYKVIADYPKCPFVVGDIIPMTKKEEPFMASFEDEKRKSEGEDITIWQSGYFKSQNGKEWITIEEGLFSRYPHIFRKLKWWEERDKSNLPDYLKSTHGNDVYKVACYDLAVSRWYPEHSQDQKFDVSDYRELRYTLPATREEYEQFTSHPPIK